MEDDWCARRHRLSVVKAHDGPCPSRCVHVMARLSPLLVYLLCPPACVSFLYMGWAPCVLAPQIDVTYLGVTNALLAPAVFGLKLMGSCLPYSLIKLGGIQRRVWSWAGRQLPNRKWIYSRFLAEGQLTWSRLRFKSGHGYWYTHTQHTHKKTNWPGLWIPTWRMKRLQNKRKLCWLCDTEWKKTHRIKTRRGGG